MHAHNAVHDGQAEPGAGRAGACAFSATKRLLQSLGLRGVNASAVVGHRYPDRMGLLCLLALGTAARAQAPNTDRMEKAQKARAELQKRFDAADTNKDGKLSREEAQAKMPRVYKSFDTIDTSHTGTISLADIEAFLMSKKGSRKSAS
jgi:hypothetical protein